MSNLPIAFALLGVLYALFALILLAGWSQLPIFKAKKTEPQTRISIILAARNESLHITNCVNALLAQDYPKNLLEIIVVNDRSEDDTAERVHALIPSAAHALHLIDMQEGQGKKQALAKGIEVATGELIVTTDADCTMGEQWISTLAAYFEEHQPDLLMGPVIMAPTLHFFQRIQALEFTGILGSGAALCGLRAPLYGNGANLAYRKKSYQEAGGFASHQHLSSGDDMLLIQSIKARKGKIAFIRSTDALVKTVPAKDLANFWQQRLRWTGKNFRVLSPLAIGIGLFVFTSNVAVLASPILFMLLPALRIAIFIFLLLRGLSDLLLLHSFSGLMKNKGLLFLLLPALFFSSAYSILVALGAAFIKPHWKGRIVN